MYKYLIDITDADSYPWAGSPFLVEAESNQALIESLTLAGLTIIEDIDDDPNYPRFETANGNIVSFNMLNQREGLEAVLNYINDVDAS